MSRINGGAAYSRPPSPKFLTTRDRQLQEMLRNREAVLEENRQALKRVVSPYRPFHEVMEDGAWKDEPCFIIGGGPSLKGFDFERLRGKGRIIVINKSFLDVPFADILYFMDGSRTTFYGLTKNNKLSPNVNSLEKWKAFQGYKVYLNLVGRKLEDVYSVRALGRTGISLSLKKGLYHGNNSGTGALGLAICLQARPIYLLGIDGKFSKEKGIKKSHYHDGYQTRRVTESVFISFVKEFHKLGRLTNNRNIKVINLNPDSAVKCFPFMAIDEVLG